uniref:DUF3192 domain-containing protein n=1 Tax=Ningiella ruwaisensis TaxID=2364274 RepID=UPI00109FDEAB|nr:DUF3192 domain-containing protein [Ningiella ruwaisensis]
MSRNMVTALVVLCLLVGFKGAEFLYTKVVEDVVGVDGQDWEERQLTNRKGIQTLKIGDSLLHVTDNMGTADFNEILPNSDVPLQVLYYRTQRAHEDGLTTKDECTPLVFENQTLIGWGHEYLASVVN